MEQEEEVLKDKLARACRMLDMLDLLDFSGHISARLPGSEVFFIHPLEKSRAEVIPEDLLKVTLAGELVEGKSDRPTELPIHAAIYQLRPDVNSIAHLHPHYAIIPSIVGRDLVPVCLHGCRFGKAVPVYPHAQRVRTFEQAFDLAEALGKSRAVIMKGHGAVVAESSIEAALVSSHHLEENARLLIESSILGAPIPISDYELEAALADTGTFGVRATAKNWSYFAEKGRKEGIFWD